MIHDKLTYKFKNEWGNSFDFEIEIHMICDDLAKKLKLDLKLWHKILMPQKAGSKTTIENKNYKKYIKKKGKKKQKYENRSSRLSIFPWTNRSSRV